MTDTNQYYPKDQNIRFTMLTREQETDLFEKARAGDVDSREFLIKNHLLFAAREARRHTKGKLPDNDVVSAANFAVMKAFERFDHKLGNRFTSYLKPFICGEVAALWKNLATVRTPAKNKVEETEILTPKPPVQPSENPHEQVERDEHWAHLQGLLEKCKDVLNPMERNILKAVYEDGQNFAEIARGLTPPLSREAIRVKHNDALTKLKFAFKRMGIEGSR